LAGGLQHKTGDDFEIKISLYVNVSGFNLLAQ
jgi:hypothetical protein